MVFDKLLQIPGFQELLDTTDPLVLGVLIVFYLATIVQLVLYLRYYFPVLKEESKEANPSFPLLSIIICARNEYANLEKHIPLIMQQDYPEFQLVLVDDGSWDGTRDLMMAFEEQYPNVKATRTLHEDDKRDIRGKKFAVTIGVKAAKYEHLVFTDADCYPKTTDWLKEMATGFQSANMVLGYGAYEQQNSFVNTLIRFETMKIAKRYFGLAIGGKAYMGVGRNLAYTKKSFYDLFGFQSHIRILSGDDDLFIQDFSKKWPVAVRATTAGATVSMPKTNMSDWIKQKRRHVSTAAHYRNDIKAILFILELSSLFFFAGFVTLPLLNVPLIYWFPLLFIQLLIQYIFYYTFSKRLKEQKLWLLNPLLEVIIWAFQALITCSVWIKKPKNW
jgi:glycosyltransferase involved in cell wall biosynthesis